VAVLGSVLLLYFAIIAARFSFDQASAKSQTAAGLSALRSALPEQASIPFVPAEQLPVSLTTVASAEPKSTDNQAPGGNLRPRIDLDLCVGCGICVHVCPFNVLEIINEKAIAARLDDCTGYAACAAECPTDA